MIAASVRSTCVVLMGSAVVIIMVQSVPDCAVVRSAFSETLIETNCNATFWRNIVTFLFSKFRAFFSMAEMHALNGGSISATDNLSEFLHADGIIPNNT